MDAFELWCWRRLLIVPWIPRRWNKSIVKEISSEYSLEGLTLKLKLQYSGDLMQRTDSFEKTLILGKIEGRRRVGQQRMRWLDGITFNGHEFEQALGVPRQGSLVCHSTWVAKSWTRLSWTESPLEMMGGERRFAVKSSIWRNPDAGSTADSYLSLSRIPPVLLSQLSESSLTSSRSLHQRCPHTHTHPAVYRMGRALD